jgi:N-acetylglucosamine malate deacetylase 1
MVHKNKRSVIIVCAHNDDQVLAAGGTIRKYVDEGIDVHTYIFSYGETSHPHLKPEIIANTRKKESIRASKILGEHITYFGIKEGSFLKDFDQKKLESIIRIKKPFRIFTHSPDDPHPDHQAVFKLTRSALQKINFKGDLYVFDVWNIFAFRTRNYPKLFVDISTTFSKKREAIQQHKSQTNTMFTIGWSFYLRAIMAGWNNNCKYAEVFHKIPIYDENR